MDITNTKSNVGNIESDHQNLGNRAKETTARLESLDALRGFDMLWIIGGAKLIRCAAECFNFSWLNALSEQLEHVEWEGFHAYDLIFPLFLFIAGVAIPLSIRAQQKKGHSNMRIICRATIRMVLLVSLGIVYNGGLAFNGIENTRFASVLGLIGIGYYFAFLIVMHFKIKVQIIACAAIILGYWALLMWYPVPEYGCGLLTAQESLASFIDQSFLPGRLHGGNYDPEGIMQAISSISMALLGAISSYWLTCQNRCKWKNSAGLFVAGILLICIGLGWGNFYPIIKKLWTGSFILLAAGWSMTILSAFFYIIDCVGIKKWAFIFKVIGMNSITIYLGIKIINFEYTNNFIFGGIINFIPGQYQQLGLFISLIVLEWLFLYLLYKKKIFLKI